MGRSVEELKQERELLDSQFESGLPNYLVDYFDKEELDAIKDEFYAQIREKKGSTPIEERRKYKSNQEKEFGHKIRVK